MIKFVLSTDHCACRIQYGERTGGESQGNINEGPAVVQISGTNDLTRAVASEMKEGI